MDENAARIAAQLTQHDMQVLATCTLLAAMAGLVRSIDDLHYRNCLHLFSLASISGFIGLASVAMVAQYCGSVIGHELLLVACALFIGLGGKAVEVRLRELAFSLLDGFVRRVSGNNDSSNGGKSRDDSTDG